MTDTDKPATPEFDMAASVARFFAERGERNRRAEAVRPGNRAALFDALATAGITLVTVTFDGYGAPEIEGRCIYESDLAWQAKIRLAEILQGRRVEILRQGTDRYGRTLAAIRVEGQDVGDVLVGEGLARTWAGRREAWC